MGAWRSISMGKCCEVKHLAHAEGNHTTRYMPALYKLPSVRYIPALYKVKRARSGVKWAAFKKYCKFTLFPQDPRHFHYGVPFVYNAFLPFITTLQPLTPHPPTPPTTTPGISEVILSQQATNWDDGFFLKFPRIIHNAVLGLIMAPLVFYFPQWGIIITLSFLIQKMGG